MHQERRKENMSDLCYCCMMGNGIAASHPCCSWLKPPFIPQVCFRDTKPDWICVLVHCFDADVPLSEIASVFPQKSRHEGGKLFKSDDFSGGEFIADKHRKKVLNPDF